MKEINKIREKAASCNEKAGKINCYICEKCGKETYTINLEDGVTPFMIKCRHKCGGSMKSTFYKKNGVPTMEWWRPESEKELINSMNVDIICIAKIHLSNGLGKHESFKMAKDSLLDHWKSGGLFLREIQNQCHHHFQ